MFSHCLLWGTLCAVTIAIFICAGRAQSDTCPVFGNDQLSSVSRSTLERIFLNFEAPSQCRGNVTTWTYCHYPSAVGGDVYGARFLVYRRSSPTSDNYLQVAGSVSSVMLSESDVQSFQCRQLPVTQPFEIQENDIIAACVWDDGSVNPLYLVGDTGDANAMQRLYQVSINGYEDCLNSQLASVDTSRSDFRHRQEFILHLQAGIAVPAFCRVGDNPPASSPNTAAASGTYLNTANQVNCATQNTITSWHYCYYPEAVTPGQTYTMTVGVWSLDSSATTYQLTSGSSHTISLTPVATLAKIFCVVESLDPADYVFVFQGDVIGVTLPVSNAIPVLSSASGSSLLQHSETMNTASLLASNFSTFNSALHIFSNLEFFLVPTMALTTNPPTTEAPTTTEVPTQDTTALPVTTLPVTTHKSPNTDRTATNSTSIITSDKEEQQDPSYGVISAIIVSIIAAVSILAVVVLMLLLCTRHKRKSRGGIDVTYDVKDMSVHTDTLRYVPPSSRPDEAEQELEYDYVVNRPVARPVPHTGTTGEMALEKCPAYVATGVGGDRGEDVSSEAAAAQENIALEKCPAYVPTQDRGLESEASYQEVHIYI